MAVVGTTLHSNVKMDLWGSSQSKAALLGKPNTASRKGVVTGLNNADKTARLNDAIVAGYAEARGVNNENVDVSTGLFPPPIYHPHDQQMQLVDVEGFMFGPDRARIILKYRSVNFNLTDNTPDPFAVADFRTSFRSVAWHRTEANGGVFGTGGVAWGHPAGDMMGGSNNPSGSPGVASISEDFDTREEAALAMSKVKSWNISIPGLSFLVNSRASESAVKRTFQYIGMVNSGDITFGSLQFNAERVRYDGVSEKWVGNSSYPYQYQYKFTASSLPFARQGLLVVANGTKFVYGTREEADHRGTVNFANGAFI